MIAMSDTLDTYIEKFVRETLKPELVLRPRVETSVESHLRSAIVMLKNYAAHDNSVGHHDDANYTLARVKEMEAALASSDWWEPVTQAAE